MRRRTLLATVATGTLGLAGCQFATGDPAGETPGDATGTDERTNGDGTGNESAGSDGEDLPEPPGRTSVIELETVPRTYALHPTSMWTDDEARVALWFDRTATADHPARVTGWLENANDFENTFQVKWIPGVGRTNSRPSGVDDPEARLHFAPTDNNELAKMAPAVEQTDSGNWNVNDVGPWMSEYHRLGPGERVRLEYVLVGEPGYSGRPTGTYEFRGRGDAELTVAVWETGSPGPADSSRFQDRSLPALNGETSVQWYHEADETTTASVRPSTEQLELDGRIDFEMVNHSHETLGCGHWNLHKLVDGEWYHVGPTVHTADCRRLEPGGRITWSLRAFNGDVVPCDGGRGYTRGYLGGGEYAVVAGYGHQADESAALIELVGDPANIVPTADASAERDGDTVTVTTDRYGDGERPPDATFAVERADGTDEADGRLIPEQIMSMDGFGDHHGGLRNALAFFEPGVDRVVVRTDERSLDRATGHEDRRRRFEIRGQIYQIVPGNTS